MFRQRETLIAQKKNQTISLSPRPEAGRWFSMWRAHWWPTSDGDLVLASPPQADLTREQKLICQTHLGARSGTGALRPDTTSAGALISVGATEGHLNAQQQGID